MFLLKKVKCGVTGASAIIPKMDAIIPKLTSTAVNLIKIGVPVLLIILGMLDLGKAVAAQKEDEIKKAQQMFVKRLLSAALVFFVFVIVELVFNIVASNETTVWNCVNCFINNNCVVIK